MADAHEAKLLIPTMTSRYGRRGVADTLPSLANLAEGAEPGLARHFAGSRAEQADQRLRGKGWSQSAISILPPHPFRLPGKVAHRDFNLDIREGKSCIPTVKQTFANSQILKILHFWNCWTMAS